MGLAIHYTIPRYAKIQFKQFRTWEDIINISNDVAETAIQDYTHEF